jgi:hypothetical protein
MLLIYPLAGNENAMVRAKLNKQPPRLMEWARLIPSADWKVYQQVIDEAQSRDILFALGGAFVVATYTGYWRDTKDLDIYVLPEYREQMIDVLTSAGLTDYYDQKPYDRWWIYRGNTDGILVDVIWATANHRAQIDGLWMAGPEVEIWGRRVKVLPAEAVVWDKLYIMQRDRCDWPDILNLLYFVGHGLDWEYLLERIGDDRPLLAGVMSVFRWVAPARAQELPSWIWEKLQLAPMLAAPAEKIEKRRVDLLDTRPWFGPDRAKLQPAA